MTLTGSCPGGNVLTPMLWDTICLFSMMRLQKKHLLFKYDEVIENNKTGE